MSKSPKLSEFVALPPFLIGPNPETGEPNSWLYWPGNPPRPLSAEDNEATEKQIADVLNNGFDARGKAERIEAWWN